MYNLKKIKFARFGGLSQVVQKGYDKSMIGYSSPPSRRGFYAFIWPHYVPFMIGSESWSGINTKHSKFEFVKDKFGEKVKFDNDCEYDTNFMKKYTTIEVDGVNYWIKPKRVKIFTYNGDIWHHLGDNISPNKIIHIKGSWYLTSYINFLKCLSIEHRELKKIKKSLGSNSSVYKGIIIDHLEVFIERIK